MNYFVHQLAVVEDHCEIGEGTKIWHFAHVRTRARLGQKCIIGKNVFIDAGVKIGNFVKIQNNVSVYHGVEIGDGVFVGPHVCFTNDLRPRAVGRDGQPLSDGEWQVSETKIENGAALGANSTIVTGHSVGKWAMVGAGSVVSRNVPPYALVYGNPARIRGVVSASGEIVSKTYKPGVYKTKDGKEMIEILPEWCSQRD